jgi:opacity protein-like surface antigen
MPHRFGKKMLLLFITLFFAGVGELNAQHLVFVFGHALYAPPVDKNFKNNYTSGLGVEGGAGIGWNKTFLVGTIGYSNFFHESGNDGGDLHYIPFKAGLRQYIFLKDLYIHGDVGLGKINDKTGSASRFSGDIGAGIKFAGLELQLDYDGFTRSDPSGYASWLGIKAGFNIGL